MEVFAHSEDCVDAILTKVGKRIRLAVPLAIGKPNHFVNALYRRAVADSAIDLHIFTALTLQRPVGKSDLEKRFLGPLAERLWGDYPDLDYERDRMAGRLPKNVRVFEFYLYAGKYLGQAAAQRDYISTNYTHVARDLLARGVNVIAQQVCRGELDGHSALSMSCNPDVSPDLIAGLRESGCVHATVGEINAQLPFMHGDALIASDALDFLIDDPRQYHRPFATPKTAITDAEYMIGLYASTLVRDGGCLQIGIGAIGDALVYALVLRHKHNDVYRELLARLRIFERFGDVIAKVGGTEPFSLGLFAASEMLVDGFMHLIEAGIIKRAVYDDVFLQRLRNAGEIEEAITPRTLDALLRVGAIPAVLDQQALRYLQHWGVFASLIRFREGRLELPDGTLIAPSLLAPDSRARIDAEALGTRLQHGSIVHAAFFLGPHRFYDWLRALPEEQRSAIAMRPVTRVNQLFGDEALARLQRRDARFINTGMLATLLGAVVSDGLESGQVVSGVGGQYNFVAMAHELKDARSILQVRSTRMLAGAPVSNIVYAYGHTTIPRHLRDLLITDHGIADLRGRTDEEVIEATLAVSDAAFQAGLVGEAQKSGKLRAGFELPSAHRNNQAQHYAKVLDAYRSRGFFAAYPFGTELTEVEVELAGALRTLQERMQSASGKLAVLRAALTEGAWGSDVAEPLSRMQLAAPRGAKERLYARLIAGQLRQARSAKQS